MLVVAAPRAFEEGMLLNKHRRVIDKSFVGAGVLSAEGLKKFLGPSISNSQAFSTGKEIKDRYGSCFIM